LIERYDVRCPGPHAIARLLSGGNMQKILLGRTLWWEPGLILANQPTRGLDVGAVAFVHEQLQVAKERGSAVLLISEDLDEIYAVADSIVVMASGRVSRPLPPGEVSVERLGLMMAGHL
jgi:simple sugar transport system ATP-binding protein